MKNRRNFLQLAAAGTLGALAARAEPEKPNVVFIFTDDQRFDTIAALGNPHIHTPNLDRLAKRSFVFRNAYNFGGNTGAVCIPARNMAMTGKTFFCFDAGPRDKGLGPTFPKNFKSAGYETFNREKSGSANLPYIRTQFDHYGDIHMVNQLRTGYAARTIVNDAVQFMEKDRNQEKPFFIYLGFPCPHDPRWAAPEFRDLYDPDQLPLPPNYKPVHPYDMDMMTIRDECLEAWPRTEAAIRRHLHDYYALISCMDADIGRLLASIEKYHPNTIVIFSSDQGIALGSHGLMGKQSVYEDVQRVPLFFSGPGIPKGESEAFAYVHDIFPTACQLVGAPKPEGIDGKSLAPIIRGEQKDVRDALMLAYVKSQRSVRDKKWKLIQLPQINITMLFDLETDPHETINLADDPEKKRVVERMMKLLEKEQLKYGDNLPLVSDHPKPAEFIPPTEKLKTAHPAGGLAPEFTNKDTKQDTPTPANLSADASAFIGVWEYNVGKVAYSREFTKDGKCILLRGGKLSWEKPITACKGSSLVVDGNYNHELLADGSLKIEGKYTANRKMGKTSKHGK
jgi:arylsulfatase A-like enzyme